MTTAMNTAPASYSIEEFSVKAGIPQRTLRRMAGKAGFPGYRVEGIAIRFDAATVDAWIAAHRAEIADYPCRLELGPYRDAQRAEVVARQLQRLGVNGQPVERSGEQLIVIPIADGVAPADAIDELKSLFPTLRPRLFDVVGYVPDTAA